MTPAITSSAITLRPSTLSKSIDIYTDGACSGNPGPGGFGTVLIYKGSRKELSGGFRRTTNNRMELMSLIAGLEALREPCTIKIHTDSQYLLGAFEKKWIRKWKANGWQTTGRKSVSNRDLWERLDNLLQPHKTSFVWIKGHADNVENNRCDQMAVEASRLKTTPPDAGYEAANP